MSLSTEMLAVWTRLPESGQLYSGNPQEMKTLLAKLFKVRKRNEIRGGKHWTITQVLGFDLLKKESPPAEPLPLVIWEGGVIDKMAVHVIKGENNTTNLTKNAELL